MYTGYNCVAARKPVLVEVVQFLYVGNVPKCLWTTREMLKCVYAWVCVREVGNVYPVACLHVEHLVSRDEDVTSDDNRVAKGQHKSRDCCTVALEMGSRNSPCMCRSLQSFNVLFGLYPQCSQSFRQGLGMLLPPKTQALLEMVNPALTRGEQ